MSATAAPATSDRSDFRTVTVGGAKLGALTAAAVLLFIIASRSLAGAARTGAEVLIVLAAGIAVSFLPGRWTAARQVEGIAGAAALGLVGALVFTALDIVVLRPLKAYPWTWDAIGGGSSWWYVPVWWMLGTFLAWMGAIVTAGRAGREGGATARTVLGIVAATIVIAAAAHLSGVGVTLPPAAGGAFALALVLAAVITLVRQG